MSLGHGSGIVDSFDADVGLGQVLDERGARWLFHCTAIADGSRVIDVGAAVEFEIRSGGPGRWEAFSVSKLPVYSETQPRIAQT
jgi:cold shock CspA family protein